MSYSKLVVKNFGKIKEAEIELSDLVLFIGDNNSGKSYLMTLIYGFANYSEEILNILFQDEEFLNGLEEYRQIETIIMNNVKYNEQNYTDIVNLSDKYFNIHEINLIKKELDNKSILSKEDLKSINNLLNLLLNKFKEKILQLIFNTENTYINLDYINLSFSFDDFIILFINEFSLNIINKKHFGIYSKNGETIIDNIKDFLIMMYIDLIKYSLSNDKKTNFLPTSRTGFFLSYRELARQSIISKFTISYGNTNVTPKTFRNEKTMFQKTIIDFINNLIDLSKEYSINEEYTDIIEIFHNMIQGSIEVNPETGGYYYNPDNTDLKIPMYLNSAVITETAPLYLFLKYGKDIGALFIEEPEMSLHLKLQKQMARIIINLVNKNINLIISTHSDTILEHINNMIKLNSINDKDKKNNLLKKYSYTENDIIDIEKIRIYQFNTDKDNTTNIIPLEGNKKTGFYIETFHDYINKASNEYDEINESI